ncbi:cardiotrophin-like cytokine factor 1 [Clupea harengus]|uniref:Cardiotrophin-like cytokine factor 1 n=1 Tax=Clupea harengus TaxID=7950 RepID=A0A6P8ESQ2_CLUHA|nr:cardiotrophin-like cytokine factor 1 [Clupea harengus]
MCRREAVRCAQLALLLAAAVGCVQVPDLSLTLTNERTTIERTYELTKYLEHQLKDIKDTYLSYLGPPFSDPDFSPPRPNSSSLSVPSAATRVELWRGLENGARLAQNQRAYRVLLCAMRELAHSTLCPYLQSSLLHFCSGLNGLLGSITGLMGSIGYTPPQLGDVPPPLPDHPAPPLLSERRSALRGSVMTGQHSPAPLRAQQRHYGDYRPRSRDDQRYSTAAMGGPRRPPRSLSSSLYAPTLPPSLSLLLQYGTGEGGAHALLAASPLLSSSAHPTSNEFSRKVEGFWVLRELQSWLWRSAKDFTA